MANSCYAMLADKDQKSHMLDGCIYFTVLKELYTPYTQLKASFSVNKNFALSPCDVRMIHFFVNGKDVHFGLSDEVEMIERKSERIINISSRGFTSLLGQNQPQPGINSDVNLESIIRGSLDSERVLIEELTPAVNYIYVKENSTLWDAVTAYGLKAVRYYPFVRGNTVCLTVSKAQNADSGSSFIEKGEGISTVNMLSKINMKDIDDNYSFVKTNPIAEEFNIEREKYYNLDRQWLSDSDVGLTGKINYSNRKSSCNFYSYYGNRGEDLMDKIVSDDKNFNGKRISQIVITGSKNGIITKICCYNDKMSQRKEV